MTDATSKTSKRRKKQSPPLLLPDDRDHVDRLLDEALQGTFPASDPVAISGDRIAERTSSKRG
jgi:hypothetical protein